MLSIAVTQAACILCLMIIQIWYHPFTKIVSPWLPIIILILSNDIELNPGPHFQNSFFLFHELDINPSVKNKFERVHLIEAHNSIFNSDFYL